jgi:hypothetical protein
MSPDASFNDESESSNSFSPIPQQQSPCTSSNIDGLVYSESRDTLGVFAQSSKGDSSFLGSLSATSKESHRSNLDWALVKIHEPSLFWSLYQSSNFPFIQEVVQRLRDRSAVQVITASNIIQGYINGNATFIQLPNSIEFQEMWTVQLDGPLRE